jgi:hypothetical protein
MAAIDYKKLWQELYAPPAGEFTLVEVPELRFLMVDGRGNPNTAPEYAAALEALYGVAYGAKMACKRELGLDYVVPPLEGLWWADDMAAFAVGQNARQDGKNTIDDTGKADAHNKVIILESVLPEGTHGCFNTGVVHKDMDISEFGFHLVSSLRVGFTVGDVQLHAENRPALFLEERQHLVNSLLTDVGDDDLHACTAASLGDAQADTAGCTCDKCDFPL